MVPAATAINGRVAADVWDMTRHPAVPGTASAHLTAPRPELLEAAAGLLRTVPGNVAVLDVQGRIVLTNAAWDDFAAAGGGGSGCGIGTDYLEVCVRAAPDEDAAQQAADAIRDVVASGGSSVPFAYPCETPAGMRWFLMTAGWWGELPGVVVSHVDITEAKVSQEASEASLRAVGHDLRSPLTIIVGMGRLLQARHEALAPEQREVLLGRLLAAAHRLDHDLDNLTSLDRLAGGTWAPRPVDTDVATLVAEVVADLDLPEGRVRIDVAEDLRCTVDGPWLERIIVNLVANGVRHTPAEATVWVRIGVADGRLTLVVEDDGPGIPPEDRSRILSAYERADARTPGSGLGLAIVSRFTALLGGELSVGERPGGGARFTVEVPVGGTTGDGATETDDGGTTVR